ncbi:MAG: VOC family protein [Verrucomicrobiae bacterium]|nr:VOC family protein [Verrucomicrobiae bacterium]
MSDSTPHIPEGYHSVTPYLIVKGAAKAIEFYADIFGATEEMRLEMPGGVIGHAEIRIGDSKIMLGDECPQMQALSPETVGGTPVGICLYVADVDAVFEKALASGVKVHKPVADQFYGDRSGTFFDPFGHMWTVATRKETLTVEEIRQRAAAMMQTGDHKNCDN